MKQPEDRKTIDMLDQVKRGRGRPRVDNPLTPAERARRYRDRIRAIRDSTPNLADVICDDADVTEKPSGYGSYFCPIHGWGCSRDTCFDQTVQEVKEYREGSLGRELNEARRRIEDLTGALDEVVQVAASGRRVPSYMLKGLVKLLADA